MENLHSENRNKNIHPAIQVTEEKEYGVLRESTGWSYVGWGSEKASEVLPFAGEAEGTWCFML